MLKPHRTIQCLVHERTVFGMSVNIFITERSRKLTLSNFRKLTLSKVKQSEQSEKLMIFKR
jgi:hypothetical protein